MVTQEARAGLGLGVVEQIQHANRRGWLIRRMLVCADALGLLLAFFSAKWLPELSAGDSLGLVGPWLLFFVLALPVWIVMAKLYGLYDRDDALAPQLDGRRPRRGSSTSSPSAR